MSAPDPVIIETLDRILQAAWDPTSHADEDFVWQQDIWTALEETGLTLAWTDEAFGGAGAGIADGFGVVRAAAGHAAPVPLAETLLAARVLSDAGLQVPQGPLNVAIAGADGNCEITGEGEVNGRFSAVGFARHLGHLVVVMQSGEGADIALVPAEHLKVTPGEDLSGEPADDVDLVSAKASATAHVETITPDGVVLLGAALRAQQMAGALQSVLGRTVAYAQERRQFGRSISKFQAVQHNLARLAGEVAAAGAAADGAALAVERYGLGDPRTVFAVAAAKVRCGAAASEGGSIAHQVHGAMGFAAEYPLHLFTRRLWAWRDDYGSETEWAERLGGIVARNGADAFWPALSEA